MLGSVTHYTDFTFLVTQNWSCHSCFKFFRMFSKLFSLGGKAQKAFHSKALLNFFWSLISCTHYHTLCTSVLQPHWIFPCTSHVTVLYLHVYVYIILFPSDAFSAFFDLLDLHSSFKIRLTYNFPCEITSDFPRQLLPLLWFPHFVLAFILAFVIASLCVFLLNCN